MDGDKVHMKTAALRDFFISRDASEMAQAYRSIMEAVETPAPIPEDWESIEFAYNRLFVGPKAILAPPYASVYLDSEPQIMGVSTMRARQIYGMLGLTSPWKGSLPDDHLSLELDASIHLKTALSKSDSEEMKALWHYFLIDHLGLWIPRFVKRIQAGKSVPKAILFAADQLMDWLGKEISTEMGRESKPVNS